MLKIFHKENAYSTFLVHEDEEVISRDFMQQLWMERLRWPEVSCYTALVENIKIIKNLKQDGATRH